MAIGPPFLLPIIMFWMKDTTVIALEEIQGQELYALSTADNENESYPTMKQDSFVETKIVS